MLLIRSSFGGRVALPVVVFLCVSLMVSTGSLVSIGGSVAHSICL